MYCLKPLAFIPIFKKRKLKADCGSAGRLPSGFFWAARRAPGRCQNCQLQLFSPGDGKEVKLGLPSLPRAETRKQPPPHFPKVTPGSVSITALKELQRVTPPFSYRPPRSLVKTQKAMRLARPRRGGTCYLYT